MVGGLDQSASLIGFASEAMPDGHWSTGDAASIDVADRWDVVLACGVFMYFADHHYASRVIAAMMRKATRAVAILDVPDLATRDEAIAFRRGSLGEAEYEAKYRGLDHLFYDRSWMRDQLIANGAADVVIEDQQVAGYQNARFRFNARAVRSR
jgi:trans-aconitate methyltransferase